MFIHSVYYWMKPGRTAEEVQQFCRGLESLTKIKSVRHGFFGKPAVTDRPVIDRTYSYGLVVIFDDIAGHNAYDADPVHTRFRESFGSWSQIKIYDFEGDQ